MRKKKTKKGGTKTHKNLHKLLKNKVAGGTHVVSIQRPVSRKGNTIRYVSLDMGGPPTNLTSPSFLSPCLHSPPRPAPTLMPSSYSPSPLSLDTLLPRAQRPMLAP